MVGWVHLWSSISDGLIPILLSNQLYNTRDIRDLAPALAMLPLGKACGNQSLANQS